MKNQLRYYFARFAVLLLALHILDVSIDFDFATSSSPVSMVEKYDDPDSFSELILEKIFNNDNLVSESDNDDHQRDNHKVNTVHAPVLYCVEFKKIPAVNLPVQAISAPAHLLKNTSFQFEDHSRSLYTPPDL